MKGLLLMNCYNMKVYLRQYLILMVFFLIFGIATRNPFYIMGMSLVVGINLSFSSFSFEEAGGYAYLLSVPVTRKIMVQAKYVIQLAGAAFILVCSAVEELITWLSTGETEEGWLLSLLCILGVYFLFVSVLIPVTYRYSTEKARIVMIGMIAVPMLLVFLGAKLLQIRVLLQALDALSWLFVQRYAVFYAGFLFLVCSVLILWVSYVLSVRIFEKTDF